MTRRCLSALLALTACYSPKLDDCRITCRTEALCPDDLRCVDGWCRTNSAAGTCASQGAAPWTRVAGSATSTSGFNAHPVIVQLAAPANANDRIIVAIAVTTGAGASPAIDDVRDELGHEYTLEAVQPWTDLGCAPSPCNGLLELYSAAIASAGAPMIAVDWTGTGGYTISAVAYANVGVADVATSTQGFSLAPSSGTSAATSRDHELAIGAFADDGFSVSYTPDGGASVVIAAANRWADLVLTELDSGARGSTPRAGGSISSAVYWAHALVVFTAPDPPR